MMPMSVSMSGDIYVSYGRSSAGIGSKVGSTSVGIFRAFECKTSVVYYNLKWIGN